MNIRIPALLITMLFWQGTAHSAGTGLRLPATVTLDNLVLESGSGDVPGVSADAQAWSARNAWMAAAWRPFGEGLRTSVGFFSRERTSISPLQAEQRQSDSDIFSRPTSPYLGVGWSGPASRGSRLQLSAEFGMLMGYGECSGGSSCLRAPITLKLGDGIRMNPFVTFGATYRY